MGSKRGPPNPKINDSVNKSLPAKVFLVDDHPIVAAGLARLFEEERDLVLWGHARTADSIREILGTTIPDLFMAEIVRPTADGFQMLAQLKEHYGQSRFLVFSAHDEGFYAERALQSGAHGYLMKSDPPEKILEAVRTVLDGNFYISNRLQSILFSKLGSDPAHFSNPVENLSNRELQVLQLIGHGRSNREIAELLKIQLKTVEAHRFRIREKLNLKHSAELTQFAIHMMEGQETLGM